MPSKQSDKRTAAGVKSAKDKRPQKNEKKRWEFSKVMAVIAITMWVFVNLFGMAMVIFTADTSPLMYVIPSVDAVVAAVLCYYFSKAKAENQIKLKRLYGVDVSMDGFYFDSTNSPYTPVVSDTPLYENSNIV